MELKSMQMSKTESKEAMEIYEEPQGPKYPYGLRICLDKDALDKLGLDKMPELKTTMMLTAKVEVCAASVRSDLYGDSKSLDLQITDMALGTGSDE